MAYTPRPIPTDDVALPPDLEALAERLAEHVHDVWAEGRFAEGWMYGPRRNDEAKTHPGLVTYDDLSETEKDFDRRTAEGTLKAVLSLGYRISHSSADEKT